jgi:DNA replication protein DnaC
MSIILRVDGLLENMNGTVYGEQVMAGIDSQTRADLLEIIDDRAANKATIITSQLPIEHWHAWIGDATIADAILDRVMQKNHRFTLTGESLRQKPKSNKKEVNPDPS